MRPNHQNKRLRGRNRGSGGGGGGGGGGGKGPNPLTRSYESNGPDVKIRGTAHHVAEKYLQLGRDAQATGDHVNAENYFQHAEHYLRIIAAANEQMRLANPNFRPYEMIDQDAEDDEDEEQAFANAQQGETRYAQQPQAGDGEQPDISPRGFPQREGRDFQPRNREFQPRNREFQQRDQQPRDQRDFQPREQREPRDQQPREQRDFQPREPRDQQPREQRDFQPREQREPREPREFQPREPRPEGEAREGRFNRFDRRGPRPERPAPAEGTEQPGLPAFITAPVRSVPVEAPEPAPSEAPVLVAAAEGEGFPVKERRRRGRPRKVVEGEAPVGADDSGE